MSIFASSSHRPCPECGASIAVATANEHVCDPERMLDLRMFQLRDEIARFEGEFHRYLDSAHGRFAEWLAERRRPQSA